MARLKCCPLQWRHNERDGVSNHQRLDCLLNRLFRCRSKKTSKLCITGLYEGNSPVTGEFPAQMASNAENVSIWWRHHVHIGLALNRCVLTVVPFHVRVWGRISISPSLEHRRFYSFVSNLHCGSNILMLPSWLALQSCSDYRILNAAMASMGQIWSYKWYTMPCPNFELWVVYWDNVLNKSTCGMCNTPWPA